MKNIKTLVVIAALAVASASSALAQSRPDGVGGPRGERPPGVGGPRGERPPNAPQRPADSYGKRGQRPADAPQRPR